jgi:hypothetical protein
MGYRLGNLGIWFQFHASAENFSLFQSIPSGYGTPHFLPPIQWVPEVCPGIKSPEYADIKNVCSYTLTSVYIFMAWALIQHNDNLTCTCCLAVSRHSDTERSTRIVVTADMELQVCFVTLTAGYTAAICVG